MQHKFTYQINVRDYVVAELDGVADVDCIHGGTDWCIAGISLEGVRGHSAQLVPITTNFPLYKEIALMLYGEERYAIDLAWTAYRDQCRTDRVPA